MTYCFLEKAFRKNLKEIVPSAAKYTIVKIKGNFRILQGLKITIQDHFHIFQF